MGSKNRSSTQDAPPPELAELGWRIKKIRQQLGLTRSALGEMLGLDTDQIGKIERGRRNASTLLLCRIASVFHCDLESLLRGIPSQNEPGEFPQPSSSPPPPPPGIIDDGEKTHRRKISSEEIRRFRRQNGLSQTKLGRLCGVKQTAVVRWEAGVGALSDASSILLEELLDGRRNLNPLTVEEERLLNEIVERGEFETREAFLSACLLGLMKQRELVSIFAPEPQAAELFP
jgi:transcriptional regulator with XRE-family HTH domain